MQLFTTERRVLILTCTLCCLTGCSSASTPLSCGDAETGRSFVIVNNSGETQYVNLEWPISLALQQDGAWEAFSPWAGCATVCETPCEPLFCEPCDPAVRVLAPGDSLTVEWQGMIYPHGESSTCQWEDVEVSCVRELVADTGHYRVSVCHSTSFNVEPEQFGSCWGDDGVESPASLADPTCVELEFDYPACSQGSLELSIEPM